MAILAPDLSTTDNLPMYRGWSEGYRSRVPRSWSRGSQRILVITEPYVVNIVDRCRLAARNLLAIEAI